MSDRLLDFEQPLTELEKKIEELKSFANQTGIDLSDEISTLEKKAQDLRQNIYDRLSPWQKVTIARHRSRPTTLDYISLIFDDFLELHGDRLFSDDPAIVGGIAELDGQPVTVIGQQKGRDTKENIRRFFGSPHPEGYRKALRLMKQAEKFRRPIICFIDTQGAYPGIGAEERGQGWAIAENLLWMSNLKTPIISIVTGEGGSGGALALGVADRVMMLANAIYSVISPEGCASILWKDAGKAQEAAASLKLTAQDLAQLGVIDEIIPEPLGGAHKDPKVTAEAIKESFQRHLAILKRTPPEQLIVERYEKFRKMGIFAAEE